MEEALEVHYRNQVVNALFSNKDYLRCVIFREKLYEDLKLNLYNLVEKYFGLLKTDLLYSNLPDDEVDALCDNRKIIEIYRTRDFTDWLGSNGCWVLARYYNPDIPEDGNRERIDPSTLLTLVCRSSQHFPPDLEASFKEVMLLRNKFYGHVPDLSISDDLISDFPETSFGPIIQKISEFAQELAVYIQ